MCVVSNHILKNMAARMEFICLIALICLLPTNSAMFTTRDYYAKTTTQKPTTVFVPTSSYAEVEIGKLREEIQNLHSEISRLENKYADLQSNFTPHNTDNFVAFEARLSDSLLGLGRNQIVLFDNVLMNKGNGYDKRIGVFRCPVNGTYQITLSVACFGRIQLELVNNGLKVGHLFASQRRTRLPIAIKRNVYPEESKKRQVVSPTQVQAGTYSVLTPTRPSALLHGSEAATASIQFLVDLVVGDDVWVRHLDNGLNAVLLSDIYTTFSGHLIHENL